MKAFLCTLIAVQFVLQVYAQKEDRIETDRPNESELAHLVTKRLFQVESGFYYEKSNGSEKTTIHPHTLLRYGLAKAVELRLLANISTQEDGNKITSKRMTGLEPIELGMKIGIFEERNGIPSTSLLLHSGLPFLSSKNYKTMHLSPEIRLLMENGLTDKIELTYNVGVEWDGINTTPAWLYTISPEFNITPHWDGFVEIYGHMTRNEAPEHTIDGGIEYLVNNNFRLDICSGFGINKIASDFFVTLGGSIRFK